MVSKERPAGECPYAKKVESSLQSLFRDGADMDRRNHNVGIENEIRSPSIVQIHLSLGTFECFAGKEMGLSSRDSNGLLIPQFFSGRYNVLRHLLFTRPNKEHKKRSLVAKLEIRLD